jgi:hypothetical protein
MFTAVESSASSAAPPGSAHGIPSGRVAAIFARWTHRSAVPPTPTPTIVGGQVLPPAFNTQSMTNVLMASTPSAGIAIFNHELFSEPLPFGNHLDLQALERIGEIDVDYRHADAARRVLVLARQRMHDRRAQRIFAGRAFATLADRSLQRRTIDVDTAADGHVIDRDAGVLAQQIIGALGDRDVLDHRAKHRLGRSAGLARRERIEAALDIRRQFLQRANVELFCRCLDFFRCDSHGHLTQD